MDYPGWQYDLQAEAPVATCQRCLGEIYHDEAIYIWDGKRICFDCFETVVESMLRDNPRHLADMMQVDYEEV